VKLKGVYFTQFSSCFSQRSSVTVGGTLRNSKKNFTERHWAVTEKHREKTFASWISKPFSNQVYTC